MVISGAIVVSPSYQSVLLCCWRCICLVCKRSGLHWQDQRSMNSQQPSSKRCRIWQTYSPFKANYRVYPRLHNQKNIDSRLFDVLTAINPAKPNQVVMSLVKSMLQPKPSTLTHRPKMDFWRQTFKKTILATKFSCDNSGETATDPLTDVTQRFRVLAMAKTQWRKSATFSVDFVYKDELFAYIR